MPNAITAFNVNVWSNKTIERLRQANVAMAIVANTDYEGEIRQAGDTVYVPMYGRVSWSGYKKDQDLEYQDLGATREPFQVNDAEYFAFRIEDIERERSSYALEDRYAFEASVTLNEIIDTKIFSYYTFANPANVIGTSGSPITLSDSGTNTFWAQLVEAEKRLNAMNAPQAGRWIVIGTDAKAWLSKDQTLLKSAQPIAEMVIRSGRPGMTTATAPGYVGNLNNFDVFMSTNVPKVGGATANIYGQGRPISYASKFQEVERLRLETKFATAVRGLILHDGKVFDEHAKRLGVLWTN